MAATQVRLSFDLSGNLAMLVVPDNDSQLNDPAFSNAGWVNVNVPLKTYAALPTPLAVLQTAQPVVNQISKPVGTKLQTIITAMQKQATADTTDAGGVSTASVGAVS